MSLDSGAQYDIGSVRMTIVNDGTHYYDAGAIFGVVPRLLWERIIPEIDDRYRMATGLNCVLLRSEGKLILIETGVGGKPGDRDSASPAEDGTLLDSLAALDVSPDEIDIVINTHLHADHCGWNTSAAVDGDGEELLTPTFPNAKYVISAQEWDDATHPNERTRATYLERNLSPIADRLQLVDGETAITDEVVFLPTPGHTEGHGCVVIRSGGEWGLYTGDIVQHPVQFERTAWVSGLDILPLVSMETKKQLADRVIDEQALVIMTHASYPGVMKMERTEQGYRKMIDVDPLA